MPHGSSNSKNVKNDPKPNFSNLPITSSNSQGEVSVYEIDILSYGNTNGKSSERIAHKTLKKWKVQLGPELVVQDESLRLEDEASNGVEIPFGHLIKSNHPIIEARVESDLREVSFEIDAKKKPNANEDHHKHFLKETLDDKKHPSVGPKKSKEKLKSQLGKLAKEYCIEETDNVVLKSKKYLKKLANEAVHYHHHEHHHYHLNSSKPRKKKESPGLKKGVDGMVEEGEEEEEEEEEETEKEKKGKKEREGGKNATGNVSSTATYVCPGVSSSKTDCSNFENGNGLRKGKENPHFHFPVYSNSIDSFLGATSDLVMSHTFSQADLSKLGSNKNSTEYGELVKSLKVLDKYIDPKSTSKSNVKVSYIRRGRNTEKKDDAEGIESHSSEVVLSTSALEKTKDSITESINVRNSVKKSRDPGKLKTNPLRPLTMSLQQELEDIKNRLRDLETLYLNRKRKKRKKKKFASLRGNESEPRMISGRKIHVFSTKTYIMRADSNCS